jgi:homoserine dehydrogenase
VERVIRVGMLGCGTVGSGVATILHREADDIASRIGARLQVVRVAVRDVDRSRDVPLPPEVFTDDPQQVVAADDVDVVVEVMGGRHPAGDLIRQALRNGKPVVTANKELVAHEGPDLFEEAYANGVDLMYEAAVAGAIPIIKPLKESLAGDKIRRVVAILNGTTNYILTKMTEEGADYAEVLAEAQALGLRRGRPDRRRRRPRRRQQGGDRRLAGVRHPVQADDVHREGIERVTPTDIDVATRLGYVVKLLAIANEDGDDVAVRVHPTFLPREHPLASVREAFNAIYVESDFAGELMFYGRGAGSYPTGSAVVGDLVDVARNVLQTARGRSSPSTTASASARWPSSRPSTTSCSRSRTSRACWPTVAHVFGEHRVSIAQVWQTDDHHRVQLVLITHRALEQDLRATVDQLAVTEGVREVTNVLRVEAEIFGPQGPADGRPAPDAYLPLDVDAFEEGTDGPRVARHHRGVPRPDAGARGHRAGDPARGRARRSSTPSTCPR